MPRLASITTQAFTGIGLSSGKLLGDFQQRDTFNPSLTSVTGLFMDPNGINLQVNSGGVINQFVTGTGHSLSGLAADDTFTPSGNTNGEAATAGISWDGTGANMYYPTANSIEQYSVVNGDEYSITQRLAVAPNELAVSGRTACLMAPDGLTVLISSTTQVVQYVIDPFFIRSIANASVDTGTITVNNVGMAYFNSGKYLVVAQSGGTVIQYELTTPYSIKDGATQVSSLNTGLTLTGVSMTDQYMYLSTSNTVYQYS